MAKSATERTREFRKRAKEALKVAPDLSLNYLKMPFSEYQGDNYEFVEWLDALGFQNQGSLDDEFATYRSESEYSYSGKSNLERMTWLAGVFLDGARELHEKINAYKISEVDARLAEIEQADLSDPKIKKQALADVVQLTHIRSGLDKEFRRSFREINVKGTPSD